MATDEKAEAEEVQKIKDEITEMQKNLPLPKLKRVRDFMKSLTAENEGAECIEPSNGLNSPNPDSTDDMEAERSSSETRVSLDKLEFAEQLKNRSLESPARSPTTDVHETAKILSQLNEQNQENPKFVAEVVEIPSEDAHSEAGTTPKQFKDSDGRSIPDGRGEDGFSKVNTINECHRCQYYIVDQVIGENGIVKKTILEEVETAQEAFEDLTQEVANDQGDLVENMKCPSFLETIVNDENLKPLCEKVVRKIVEIRNGEPCHKHDYDKRDLLTSRERELENSSERQLEKALNCVAFVEYATKREKTSKHDSSRNEVDTLYKWATDFEKKFKDSKKGLNSLTKALEKKCHGKTKEAVLRDEIQVILKKMTVQQKAVCWDVFTFLDVAEKQKSVDKAFQDNANQSDKPSLPHSSSDQEGLGYPELQDRPELEQNEKISQEIRDTFNRQTQQILPPSPCLFESSSSRKTADELTPHKNLPDMESLNSEISERDSELQERSFESALVNFKEENKKKEEERIIKKAKDVDHKNEKFHHEKEKKEQEYVENFRKVQEEIRLYEIETERLLQESIERIKACNAVFYQCVQMKQRFEEKEKEWADWLKVMADAISRSLARYSLVEQIAFTMKGDHNGCEDILRKMLISLHKTTFIAYDLVFKACFTVKKLSNTSPDRNFLPILLKRLVLVSNKICSALETIDQCVKNPNSFDIIRHSFGELKTSDIPTTWKLRDISKNEPADVSPPTENPRVYKAV